MTQQPLHVHNRLLLEVPLSGARSNTPAGTPSPFSRRDEIVSCQLRPLSAAEMANLPSALQGHADVQFLQLLLGDGGGRVDHQVDGLGGLGAVGLRFAFARRRQGGRDCVQCLDTEDTSCTGIMVDRTDCRGEEDPGYAGGAQRPVGEGTAACHPHVAFPRQSGSGAGTRPAAAGSAGRGLRFRPTWGCSDRHTANSCCR